MVIVVDTNVLVGACMGSIASAEVVGSCLAERHKPLVGASLFVEYSNVMNRDELFRDSHLDKAERNELLDIFLACCEWTEIYYGWRPNLRDENDNHLIELAVAGGAQCIVTRNVKDLGSGELMFPGIAVLTPEAFLTKG